MKLSIAVVLLSGLLAACVPAQPPQTTVAAPPPPPPAPPAPEAPFASIPAGRVVSIRGADCADLLKLAPADREAASMFYIGYQAQRSGARTIRVMEIPVITTLAVSYCERNPGASVVRAFADAFAFARSGG